MGHRRNHLIARTRISGKVAALGWGLLVEFPHYIMERRMLKGIKERAERAKELVQGERQENEPLAR
jgi:hypothetical protein